MIATILAALSTVCSLAALFVSLFTNRRHRLPRRFSDLELEVADLEHRLASLHASHKRLNSRVSMRQAREKANEQEPESEPDDDLQPRPGESDAEWKRRVRPLLRGVPHGR